MSTIFVHSNANIKDPPLIILLKENFGMFILNSFLILFPIEKCLAWSTGDDRLADF